MMIRLRLLFSASLLLLMSAVAWAAPVTYSVIGDLNGAGVVGFITVDDQTQQILGWDITALEGPSDGGNETLDQILFSIQTGSSELSTPTQVILRENLTNPFAPPGSNDFRDFRIAAGVADILNLGPSGGIVGITDCWNCSPVRTGTAQLIPQSGVGSSLEFDLIDIPTPETAVSNGTRDVVVTLRRVGDATGSVSVTVVEGSPGSATPSLDYLPLSPTTVTWPDGDAAPKQVIVTIIDDIEVESDETIELTLTNVTGGATIGNNVFSTITIVDDDTATPATVGFAVDTASVTEGTATLDLQLNFDTAGNDIGQVSVDVSTQDGSATAGEDFAALAATVTFGPNDTGATITLTINDDTIVEALEDLTVTLSNLQGTDSDGIPLGSLLALGTASVTVQITDNEPVVLPSIDSANLCVGPNGFEFDVIVSGTSADDFNFNIAASGQAFVSPVEQFGVNFDQSGQITRQAPNVNTVGTPAFDRLLDGPVNTSAIIVLGNNQYRITGQIQPGTQPFSPGDTVDQIALRTFGPTRNGFANNVTVNACAGANSGVLEFDVTGSSVDENNANGNLEFSVTRTGSTTGAVDVTVTATAGTATEGDDYQSFSATVSFADGDGAPRTLSLDDVIIDDADAEADETFTLVLSNPTNGAVLGTLTQQIITIVDNDGTGPDAGQDVQTDGPLDDQVEIVFSVNGVFPITLAATLGVVTPATLTAPGDVTYTFTAQSSEFSPGDTINDTVILTDANNDVTQKQVTIDVIAAVQAARNLSEIDGLTRNQRQLAQALDSLCPRLDGASANPDTNDLAAKCVSLRDDGTTDPQAITALDAINPEELAVLATSALRLSTLQHGNLEERINGLRSGASGIDLAGLDIEIQGQRIPGNVVAEIFNNLIGGAAGEDDFARWGLFADGKVKWGDKDRTANESDFDFDVAFLTIGADYRFRQNLVAGGALSWGKIKADFGNGGEFDIDSWNVSLFGTYFAESFYLDALLTYGENDYDTERRILYTDVSGLVDLNAMGSSDGNQLSGGLSGGYDFNRGAFTFGPHLGTYLIDLDVDSFVESGAGGLNMVIGDQGAKSFTVNAGLHGSYVFTPSWGVLIPHVRVDSVFEFEDDATQVSVGFAADPFRNDPSRATPTIRIETDKPDDQYLVFSAGLSAQFVRGVSAFVNYQYTSSLKDWSVQDVTWGLRWERSF